MTPERNYAPLLAAFAIGLVLIGTFRWATLNVGTLSDLTLAPTLAFVALTVFVMLRIVHSPIGWGGIGFAVPFKPVQHIGLGLVGAAAVIIADHLLEPIWVDLFGAARDLTRFDSITSLPNLLMLLGFSWAFAAFGEEFAFRGLLMRGLTSALGNGRGVVLFTLLAQAVIFGLVHSYQGPAGVAGATIAGLVFGLVVLIARGSLWPAIFAHGFANTYGLVSLWLSNG